jgi:hypothetical protein
MRDEHPMPETTAQSFGATPMIASALVTELSTV